LFTKERKRTFASFHATGEKGRRDDIILGKEREAHVADVVGGRDTKTLSP